MGRESSEKAFHRWMKIFETFPEGIALIRGGYVLYANKALKFILNIGIERSYEDDPIYELLRTDLKKSVVEQWVKNQADLKKLGQERPKQMSVWHFLINNEKGAIFQLKPKKRDKGPEDNEDSKNEDGDDHLFEDFMDEYLAEIPKYITLNQVNVKIAGGTDKLLVVRDVTSIVMNENIMETKREMSKLTDVLMRQIEGHTTVTEQKLQKLDQYVSEGVGSSLNDESINEIKKMQFRIKDFQQVYFVSENNFRHKSEPVNMKNCIDDVVAMTAADVKSRKIELIVNVDDEVPDQIACDVSKLKQVLLNLLLQNFNN
jgi:hypothetical protein